MSEKLNIGDKSGCLIVVGEFDESEKELKEKYEKEQKKWKNKNTKKLSTGLNKNGIIQIIGGASIQVLQHIII